MFRDPYHKMCYILFATLIFVYSNDRSTHWLTSRRLDLKFGCGRVNSWSTGHVYFPISIISDVELNSVVFSQGIASVYMLVYSTIKGMTN